MPMRSGWPRALHSSATGRSAVAAIGWGGEGFASPGLAFCICFQISFETVQALPFKSRLRAVTSSALVPMPIVAPIG